MRALRGASVVGVRPRAVWRHADGWLPLEKIVRAFPFDKIDAAIEGLESGEVVKPVLEF